MRKKILSHSAAQTVAAGVSIGRCLRGGEIIVLDSDLGGGKTTFVRGLSSAIGSEAQVSSPTFTLSKQYAGKKLTIHHFDFYRLGDPGLMSEHLQEVMNEPKAVIVIEWPRAALDILPKTRLLNITLDKHPRDEDKRELRLEWPESLGYLTAVVESEGVV